MPDLFSTSRGVNRRLSRGTGVLGGGIVRRSAIGMLPRGRRLPQRGARQGARKAIADASVPAMFVALRGGTNHASARQVVRDTITPSGARSSVLVNGSGATSPRLARLPAATSALPLDSWRAVFVSTSSRAPCFRASPSAGRCLRRVRLHRHQHASIA